MRTIRTKYLCPTNHKGARIKATLVEDLLESQKPISVTISYPYEKSGEECHKPAAELLLSKIGKKWGNAWVRTAFIEADSIYLGKGEYAFQINFK